VHFLVTRKLHENKLNARLFCLIKREMPRPELAGTVTRNSTDVAEADLLTNELLSAEAFRCLGMLKKLLVFRKEFLEGGTNHFTNVSEFSSFYKGLDLLSLL